MNGTVEMESGLKLIRPSPLARSHFRAAASIRLAAGDATRRGDTYSYAEHRCLACDEFGQNRTPLWHRSITLLSLQMQMR